MGKVCEFIHRRHRRPHHVAIVVNGVGVILKARQEIRIMIEATVGHTVKNTIVYLDASGNPMLTTPTPDSAPVWTQTTPATDTLTIAPDGSECDADLIAVGTDTISVSVIVGGQTFSASVAIIADAPPQVLTSVQISSVVV